MQVTKSEKFVKASDLAHFKTISFKILSEPVEVAGQYGKKLECRVKVTGDGNPENGSWGINNTCKDYMIDKFGTETSEWIGKEIPISISTIMGKEAITPKS